MTITQAKDVDLVQTNLSTVPLVILVSVWHVLKDMNLMRTWIVCSSVMCKYCTVSSVHPQTDLNVSDVRRNTSLLKENANDLLVMLQLVLSVIKTHRNASNVLSLISLIKSTINAGIVHRIVWFVKMKRHVRIPDLNVLRDLFLAMMIFQRWWSIINVRRVEMDVLIVRLIIPRIVSVASLQTLKTNLSISQIRPLTKEPVNL